MKKQRPPSIGGFYILNGGPWRNRTFNLLIKSQLLCLIELMARLLSRKILYLLLPDKSRHWDRIGIESVVFISGLIPLAWSPFILKWNIGVTLGLLISFAEVRARIKYLNIHFIHVAFYVNPCFYSSLRIRLTPYDGSWKWIWLIAFLLQSPPGKS